MASWAEVWLARLTGPMFERLILAPIRSRLGISALSSASIKVAGMGLSFAVSILLARSLGVDGLGIYAGTMALLGLLSVLAISGIPTGLVQLISRYLVAGQLAHARGSIRWGYAHVLAASLVIGALGVAMATSILPSDSEWLPTYLLAFVGLPLLCVTSVQRAVLQSFESITYSLIPEDLIKPVVFAAMLLVWVFFVGGSNAEPSTAVALQISSVFLSLIVGAVFIRRVRERALPAGDCRYDVRRWYGVSLPMLLISAAYVVLSQTDLVMLSMLEPPASAGLYRVAAAASVLVALPALAINMPLAPAIARDYERSAHESLQRKAVIGIRWAFAGAVPIALILVLTGAELIDLIYGPAFVDAYAPLVVLMIAQLFNVAAGSVVLILTMTGYQRDAARGVMIAAVANVALNAALIPPFGPLGAALGTGISTLVLKGLLLRSVVRRLGIYPTIFGRIGL